MAAEEPPEGLRRRKTALTQGDEKAKDNVPMAPPAAACTATMVYSAENLDKIKSPWLKYGDDKARREFGEAYLKYVAKHDI